jgi:hypothetical protein
LRKIRTTPQLPAPTPPLRSLIARSANVQRGIPAVSAVGEAVGAIGGELAGEGVVKGDGLEPAAFVR